MLHVSCEEKGHSVGQVLATCLKQTAMSSCIRTCALNSTALAAVAKPASAAS